MIKNTANDKKHLTKVKPHDILTWKLPKTVGAGWHKD